MGARGIAESRGSKRASQGMLLLALILSACGGSTTRQDSGANPDAAGGGTTAGGGAEPTPQWLSDMRLDDAFPWFKQDHGGSYGTLPASEDGTVTVVLEGQPVESTISTHNHLEVVSRVRGVAFRARAGGAVELRVSLKSSLDADYFGARDEGRTWPLAAVPVAGEWASFQVPMTEMRPADSTEEEPGAATFTIAFVVEAASGPVTLQLDDVRFF